MPEGIILLGLTPAIMVLLPWDFGAEMNFYRGFMRGNSLPVTIIEFIFVLLALLRGFSPAKSIAALPGVTRLGLALFALTSIWTTLFIAEYSIAAILGLIKIFGHLMFGLAFAHQLATWTNSQRQTIWPIVGLGVVGFCLLWGVNIVFYNPSGEDWMWLVPTLTNIRWIGFFALAGFCSGLGAIVLFDDGRVVRSRVALPLALCILSSFLAIWTASRGAILAILVASSITLFFARDRKAIAVLIMTAIIFALAIAAATPVPHESYGLGRLFGSANLANGLNGLSSNRIEVWLETIRKISFHPWLGWGIDQFRIAGPENTIGFRHPHQSILQLLFSTGVAGAVATTMIVIGLSRTVRDTLKSPIHLAAASYIVAGTIYGLHDGFFYYTYPVMVYLVAIAILITPTNEQTTASDRSD